MKKGTISAGATVEDMAAHIESLAAHEKGLADQCDDHSSCAQRGWIINGCYWCGADGCVNPGWIMATCQACGKPYVVNRG